MADATAILAVSNALRNVLRSELSVLAIPSANIRIESIDLIPEPVPPPRITIFLFNIQENPFLKNRDYAVVSASGAPGFAASSLPPVVVDLDFMICAWMTTTTEEHLLLGDVMRVLYDHSELSPAELGATFGSDEAVQVTLATPSLEDQTRIWTTFGFKRFKLALYYKARTVPIASARSYREGRVLERSGTAPTTYSPPPETDLPTGVP
ncbi:MAG TPA: DUF4255 domain-containing protein [Polyangiaceae bacterium]|nr:DUF4255 domain-containing protein [Polyangiaceae bacterium]